MREREKGAMEEGRERKQGESASYEGITRELLL